MRAGSIEGVAQYRIARTVVAGVAVVAMATSGCAAESGSSGHRGEPGPAATADPTATVEPTATADPAAGVAPSTSVGVPVVDTIAVLGARAALEAGQAEIRRVLEGELGRDGWTETRPAQENASSSCGGTPGVGKFYAAEMSHIEALEGERWDRVWAEIVRAVAAHGFRPVAGGGASGSGHYEYLVNEHRDELTVSSQPRIGTGYGGFSVCHPWGT